MQIRRKHVATLMQRMSIEVALPRYFTLYKTLRPHASLDRSTPDQFYFNALPQPKAA